MRVLKILLLTAATLCAAVFLFAVLTLPPRAIRLGTAARGSSTIAGAFHVHTRRSDGTGTVDEIAAAAARAGLQFVVLTDHGDGTRPADAPSYRSGVLCVDGVEISTSAGHYAAIGMRPAPYPLAGEPRDVVQDVARLGGFGVATHPDSPKPALRWHEWAAPFDGLEWLNGDSQWRDKRPARLVHTLLEYLLRGPESLASLFGRPDTTLYRFDALTHQRRVVALAGADAHARIGLRPTADPYEDGVALKTPSYEAVFRTFTLRVQLDRPLSGRPGVDALALRGALAAGHVYTAIDAFATPPEFEFTAKSGVFSARAGDDLVLGGPVEVAARVNAPSASVALYENGTRVAEGQGSVRYQAPQRPAVFRVEVGPPAAGSRPPVPWIVSNPIYAGGVMTPRRPIVRPEPARAVALPAGDAWNVEHDKRSQAAATAATPAAVDFAYALAGPPATAPFVALAHAARDVNQFDRLQFRASADHPMRLSVQMRVPQGGQRWQRSVYIDEQPRDIVVFLDDLRPIGVTTTWTLPLASVADVLFVVDTTNARPGAKGKVRLEDVRWAGP